MKKLLYSLSAMLLFLVACNKNEPATSVTDILKTGKWRMTSATVSMRLPNGSKDTTLNYFTFMQACHADDYIRFDSLTKGYIYKSAIKCNLGDPDSVSFVWKLKNNDKNIDLYNAFYLIDSVMEYVMPGHPDTITRDPLVLDTISTSPLVIDTVWPIQYLGFPTGALNIYNGKISNVTKTSFDLDFAYLGVYPDTNGRRQNNPNIYLDSLRYHITFTNF